MLSTLKNIFTPTPPATYLQQQNNIAKPSSPTTNTPVVVATSITTNESTLRRAKLIMVTTANNNKYYDMHENANGTFTVVYGRVGAKGTCRTYPIGRWESTYRSKTRKGYQDISTLVNTSTVTLEFKSIKNNSVNNLMTDLFKYAHTSIRHNYQVSAADVSIKQVEAAQVLLNELDKMVKIGMDHRSFNDNLLQLFQIIPRRMTNVKDHLIVAPTNEEELNQIKKKISEEQDTLDVMKGQVEIKQQQADTPQEEIDILQQLGLQIHPVEDAKAIRMIKKMMGEDKNLFVRAFSVTKQHTRQRFDQRLVAAKNKKTELFWHGSRNQNWLNILKTGLVLRPTNAIISGKMFGYGLYFADRFQKSLNYTSLWGSYWANGSSNTAFLALYDVHVGEQLQVDQHNSWCGQLTEKRLKQRDKKYDSVYAKRGVSLLNNEYIVYNEAQCTVRYLVEVKR